METQGAPIQLINEDGVFHEARLDRFIKESKELSACGVSYSVIAIMGPQSSGKSFLLNSIFKSKFDVMDARKGRVQTTEGIWIAKCTKPCRIVMDIEGSDGAERGQDGTSFEKRSALFALTVSDTVMVNMWHNDVGRENAGSNPLFRIVFQERTCLPPRKTTLLVVLRDYNDETPFSITEKQVKKNLQEIWYAVPKHDGSRNAKLNDYFKVEVVALPNKRYREEFEEEVVKLRDRFSDSMAPELGMVPISGFTISLKKIWNVILQNKALDLPALMVMVSKVKCEEIAKKKLQSLESDKMYLSFQRNLDRARDPDFRKKVESFLASYLNEYDKETAHYDESTRAANKLILKSDLFKFMQPAYKKMVEHLHSEMKSSFVENTRDVQNIAKNLLDTLSTFDQLCEEITIAEANWDYANFEVMLKNDMLMHVQSLIEKIHADDKSDVPWKKIANVALAVASIGLKVGVSLAGLPSILGSLN